MSLQLADVPHGSSHVSAVGGILASVSELRPAAVSLRLLESCFLL